MKSRYDFAQKIKNVNGKTVTSALSMPSIEPKDTDVYIITNATDRLDTLSNKYYETPKYWWVIAMVNNINTGTMALESNVRLFIPSDVNEILRQIKELNK